MCCYFCREEENEKEKIKKTIDYDSGIDHKCQYNICTVFYKNGALSVHFCDIIISR